MNLAILFDAPLATQIHVYAALLAFVVGAIVLWRRKAILHINAGVKSGLA